VLTVTFTGCANAGASCQNGAVAGQIVTERLAATLGYLNRRHTAVGLDLSTPPGTPLASFFCGEDLRVEVFGSVIGRIKPIDVLVEPKAHATLRFAQHEGHQAITRLVSGPRDVPMTSVLGGPLQESGLSTTDLLVFASPIEIVTDDSPPVFAGLQSATTCIPGPIGSGTTSSYHLAWEAAADDFTPSSEIVYEIYQANKAGGEDFMSPTYATAPGATSFDTPKLPSGDAFYFVVRARDQAGNEDSNTREREGQNLCE
jgi:hypothetical protein